MNIETPFFSVIIPTFNRKDFLKIAIESVLEQTCRDFELIIVDDGSTDGTETMLDNYEDQKIKYLLQENKGVSSARNRGLNESKGRFIAFLDSDDKWVAEKLETTIKYIDKFPDINIFHSEETWYKNKKLHNQKNKHKKPDGFVYFKALPLCCISISTAVIIRDVLDDIGVFDETLPACEDYDFWLRATQKYDVKLIPEYLTIKDGGRPDQLSSQPGLDKYRIQALEKMLNSKELSVDQYEHTRLELQKKCKIYAKGAEKRGKLKEAEFYKEFANKY